MEEGAGMVAEVLCDAAEKLPHKRTTAFRKVRDTVILTALAAGAYAANRSELSWQERVAVNALSFAGGVGLLASYVGKNEHRRQNVNHKAVQRC